MVFDPIEEYFLQDFTHNAKETKDESDLKYAGAVRALFYGAQKRNSRSDAEARF